MDVKKCPGKCAVDGFCKTAIECEDALKNRRGGDGTAGYIFLLIIAVCCLGGAYCYYRKPSKNTDDNKEPLIPKEEPKPRLETPVKVKKQVSKVKDDSEYEYYDEEDDDPNQNG